MIWKMLCPTTFFRWKIPNMENSKITALVWGLSMIFNFQPWNFSYILRPFLPATKRKLVVYLNCLAYRFKCEPHKMVEHTQTIRWQQPTNCWVCLTVLCGWYLKVKDDSVLPKVQHLLHVANVQKKSSQQNKFVHLKFEVCTF